MWRPLSPKSASVTEVADRGRGRMVELGATLRQPCTVASAWTITQHDELVGVIDVDDFDWPWLYGVFKPTPAFDRFRERFDEERRLIEETAFDSVEEVEAWESIQRSLRADGLCLRRPDGTAVAEFILHVDDHRAWFRYSDEPFC
jgi:hypothetical protein